MSSVLTAKKRVIAALLAIAGVGTALVGCQETVTSPAVLDCGTFEFPQCQAPDNQFHASFVEAAPEVTSRVVGGFGGQANCTPRRTPVVFVHGNADRAVNWDSDITGPVGERPAAPHSVYDEFRAADYSGCELFGLTYLTEAEQQEPANNFHQPDDYEEILDFVDAVRAFTGSEKVNIVAHSFGASMSMAAMTWDAETRAGEGWNRVERFVNIAGGIRGLESCRAVGYANPEFRTCGSQNVIDEYIFGFHPDGPGPANNDWTGGEGPHSLRSMPALHPEVAFFTISAGAHDQVHCTANDTIEECLQGALFEPAENVRAQIDVGAGTPAAAVGEDRPDGTTSNPAGGDLDGIGHFKVRNNTGRIQVEMLGTACRQGECARTYEFGPAVPVAPR